MAKGKNNYISTVNFFPTLGYLDEKTSSKNDFAKLLKVKKVQNQSNMD